MQQWLQDNGNKLWSSLKDGLVTKGATVGTLEAVKLDKDGIAIHFDVTILASGNTINQAYFLLSKHSSFYMVVIQVIDQSMDENAVNWIIANLSFK